MLTHWRGKSWYRVRLHLIRWFQHSDRRASQIDGSLDRVKLGSIVFADATKRKLLNSILHPYIIAEQDQRLREWEAEDPDGIGVVDAALMIESGGYKRFDKLIVVHCRPEVQLERLMKQKRSEPRRG